VTLDLLTLVRHEYARQHPERDTRAMPMDDTLRALANVLESELGRFSKRVSTLEAKQTAKDAE
jgi:hypothetical protein